MLFRTILGALAILLISHLPAYAVETGHCGEKFPYDNQGMVTYCNAGGYTVDKVRIKLIDADGNTVARKQISKDIQLYQNVTVSYPDVAALTKNSSKPIYVKVHIKYWIQSGDTKTCSREFDTRYTFIWVAFSEGTTLNGNHCKTSKVEVGNVEVGN